MKYILLLCLSATIFFADAQKIEPPAIKSTAFYNKTIVQIKPAYKNYVTQTAKAFHNRNLNVDSLKRTMKAPNNALFSNLTNADIETLALLVMQAANAEAYNDIKNLMAEMEKNRQKKEALRKEEEQIKATQLKVKDSSKIKTPIYTAEQAKRLATIKKDQDALSEMGQEDMFYLQQMMEQKAKLEQMISNIMKAAADSQSEISGNLKDS